MRVKSLRTGARHCEVYYKIDRQTVNKLCPYFSSPLVLLYSLNKSCPLPRKKIHFQTEKSPDGVGIAYSFYLLVHYTSHTFTHSPSITFNYSPISSFIHNLQSPHFHHIYTCIPGAQQTEGKIPQILEWGPGL